jgi:hypothetical protein
MFYDNTNLTCHKTFSCLVDCGACSDAKKLDLPQQFIFIGAQQNPILSNLSGM